MNQNQQSKPRLRLNAKRITGFVMKFGVAVVVLAFLATHSINFFIFGFPAEQQYLAWLGFGLTGGGFIAYLVVFMWEADTDLKKWTALAMSGVSGIGEILTAIFGMQVETWQKSGFTMTQEDFNFMFIAVGILAFLHAAGLTAYMAGDKVIELFSDEDGDGVPNYRDRDYRGKPQGQQNQQRPQWQPAAETERPELQKTANPQNGDGQNHNRPR